MNKPYGYWNENKEKLQSLLDRGYTTKNDSDVFLKTFPDKNLEGIKRAAWRFCKDTLDRLKGKPPIIRDSEEELPPPTLKKLPKILVLDIETSPMEGYFWRLYKQTILPHQVIKDWAILTWSAKWLCDSEIMSEKVSIEEAEAREDMSIMQPLWDLIEESDAIIGHNVAQFDLKKINTRFMINGLKPTTPYQIIDTYSTAKKHFAFSSNKMQYINTQLELEGKLETNFELWKRCVTGDASALEYMEKYNKYDVKATEELYFMFRPWIKSHINLGLYVQSYSPVCPNCGGFDLDWKDYYYTPAGKYKAFRCKTCGAIGRSRYSAYPKEKRGALTRSVAR